jgi:NAD-dependent SIR2 family protein deacetylase
MDAIEEAAQAIGAAGALLVTAGAGMGVDSGLPDFRGNEGFWRAYPPIARLGLSFAEMANPGWFARDPSLAWGFYGHRLNLYRSTTPHRGFQILRRLGESLVGGSFVFTSNVDGAFQRAGFDRGRVAEVHGAIDFLQCTRSATCRSGIFSADGVAVVVDEATLRAAPPHPTCPECGSLARPNILMFGDSGWDETRSDAQERVLAEWLEGVDDLVVVECGAGTTIPTVRRLGEQLQRRRGATLIRINARESEGPPGTVSIAAGALDALVAIERALGR